MPCIDAVRRSLSDFDLYGLKVVAIDGVELFESTKKFCDKCLSRVDKNCITHYFYRSVVCATIGSDPHIVLGQEILKAKNDSSNKDEGETTGGKRLIRRLYKKYHHFAYIIVADALYCKSTWIKEVLSIGMDAVVWNTS